MERWVGGTDLNCYSKFGTVVLGRRKYLGLSLKELRGAPAGVLQSFLMHFAGRSSFLRNPLAGMRS